MSNTIRRQIPGRISGGVRNTDHRVSPTRRDGKPDFNTQVRHDNHATGLRTEDHRRIRRQTKTQLRKDDDAGENLIIGKSRHYSDRYGSYAL